MIVSALRGNGKVFVAALDDEDLIFADAACEHRASVEVRLGHSQRQVRQIRAHERRLPVSKVSVTRSYHRQP